MNQLRVLTIVGTRPEIIRLSRIILRLENSNSIDHLSLEKELEDKVFGSSRSPSQVQVVPPSPIPGSPAIGSISVSPMLNNKFDTFDLGAATPPG